MTSPEIENLVAEAIDNRPKVTKAAMNLYIHNGKLICGARTVMPRDAAFVAHVPPDRLENGFSEKEWKLIVEKIENVLAKVESTTVAGLPAAATAPQSQAEVKTGQEKFTERRREQRLRYYYPIWFSEDFDKEPLQGQMVDVCSRGMAFTCDSVEPYMCPGQRLTTRFNVPRFDLGRFSEIKSFERTGCVCRVDDSNGISRRVAMQFAEPLPFKPGEQPHSVPD
ncbi:MAG: PilZ domain-containing protein [Sedimentisphaerales bacterium]|nr:PilZ domain-containing protein [Sedimentisphaerales bacterium]